MTKNVIGFTGDQIRGDFVVVPAEPGYYALDRCGVGDNEAPVITKHPVIAWLIEVDNYSASGKDPNIFVKPICHHELSSLHNEEVLHPDGRVFIRGMKWWDSYNEFLADETSKGKNFQTQAFDKLVETGEKGVTYVSYL